MSFYSYLKHSTIFSLICVFLILGFPRIYGTEFPLAILIMPFFCKEILKFVNSNLNIVFVYCVISFFWFVCSFAVWFFSPDSSISDCLFFIILFVKVQLAFIFGLIFFEVVRDRLYLIYIWSAIQMIIIVGSFMDFNLYSFLLGFISPRSADVFSEVFGLRTIGFGLFHIEGALIFVTSIFVVLALTRYNFVARFYLLISFVISMTVARSSIIPFILHSVFSRDIASKIYLAIIFIVLLFLSQFIDSGPLYEAFEIFRNIASDSSVSTRSTSAVIDMVILPTHLDTYIYGDGRFYSDSGLFYMGTDIGYLRILFFSGIIGVSFFVVVNLFFLFASFFKVEAEPWLGLRKMAFVFVLVFLIMNTKGIFTALIFSSFIFRATIEGVKCRVER